MKSVKPNVSSYNFFFQEQRRKKLNPSQIGKLWEKMSNDEKYVYEERARVDKERYKEEKKLREVEGKVDKTGSGFGNPDPLGSDVAGELDSSRETNGMQREQILSLQRQLLATNEKLKLATETISEYEKKMKLLEERQKLLEEHLSEGENIRKKLHNTIVELKGNIRVFCRVRPALDSAQSSAITYPTSAELAGRGIGIFAQDKKFDFTFDKVFSDNSSQQDVFVEISELVQSALDGYKVCIFAYGQTGSGKTYTMMGKMHSEPDKGHQTHPLTTAEVGADAAGRGGLVERDPDKGLIPRSLEQIFEMGKALQAQGWKYKMQASMLEIYDNNIIDLLLPDDRRSEVVIRHYDKNSFVTGLTIKEVFGTQEVNSLLKLAAEKRSVGKTQMNEQSSRSHFVFTLRITGTNEGTEQQVHGVLNLIDLAGSGRLAKSGCTGDRLKETQFINKSLSALNDVIIALGKKEKSHIPYRNSKLTDLLQPCLGGSSKTLMFVAVSPEATSADETLCSLRFAERVKSCEIGIPRRQT